MTNCHDQIFVSLVQVCEAVSATRDTLGLTAYFQQCKANGLDTKASYGHFLSGRAPDSTSVSRRDYLERGNTLENLRGEWLSMWRGD